MSDLVRKELWRLIGPYLKDPGYPDADQFVEIALAEIGDISAPLAALRAIRELGKAAKAPCIKDIIEAVHGVVFVRVRDETVSNSWPPAHIVKAVAKAIRKAHDLPEGWPEIYARAAIKAYEFEIDKMAGED